MPGAPAPAADWASSTRSSTAWAALSMSCSRFVAAEKKKMRGKFVREEGKHAPYGN